MKTMLDILARLVGMMLSMVGSGCRSLHASNGDPWRCDRRAGHDGGHEATDGEMGAQWPNIAPGDRTRAIQRVGYLMPALTDDALHAVLLVAEAAPKRSLERAVLDEEQRAREGGARDLDSEIIQAALDVGAPDWTNNAAVERARREEAAGRLERLQAEKRALGDVATPSGLMLNLEPVGPQIGSGEGKTLGEWAEDEAAKLPEPGGVPLPSMVELEAAAVAEQHDREVAALRSQVEALTAQVERFKSGPVRQAVDEAAERLGLAYLQPGGEANEAREVLFTAMGVLFGDAEIGCPKDRGKHDGIGGRPVPGEVVDVEHSGERGPRSHSGVAERFDVTPWTRGVRS